MLKNGVILDVTRSHIVVLTKDGEFLKGRKDEGDYKIGSEVSFYPLEKERKRILFQPKWAAGFAMAAVLFICAVIAFPLLGPAVAFAYVSFDVNPSIEFSVDKKGRIINAEPFNEDAERVLQKIEKVEKRPLDEVAQEWMQALERLGYMKPDSRVVVGTVPADDEAGKMLQQFARQFESRHEGFDVTVIEATESERETAADFGVTAGKYMLDKQPQPKDQTPQKDEAIKQPDVEKKPVQNENKPDAEKADPPAANAEQQHQPKSNGSNEADKQMEERQEELAKDAQKAQKEREKAERKAKEEQEKQIRKQQKEQQKKQEEYEKYLRKQKEEQEKQYEKAEKERRKQEEKWKKEQEKQQKKQNKNHDDDEDDDD